MKKRKEGSESANERNKKNTRETRNVERECLIIEARITSKITKI